MSALGQNQISAHIRAMSAVPPKADIANRYRHVRFECHKQTFPKLGNIFNAPIFAVSQPSGARLVDVEWRCRFAKSARVQWTLRGA